MYKTRHAMNTGSLIQITDTRGIRQTKTLRSRDGDSHLAEFHLSRAANCLHPRLNHAVIALDIRLPCVC